MQIYIYLQLNTIQLFASDRPENFRKLPSMDTKHQTLRKDPFFEEAEIATDVFNNDCLEIYVPRNLHSSKTSPYTSCKNSPSRSLSEERKSLFRSFTRLLGFEITKFGRFSMALLILLATTFLFTHFVLEGFVRLQSSGNVNDNTRIQKQPCWQNLIGSEKSELFTPNKSMNADCANDVIYAPECECYRINIEMVSNSVVINYLKQIIGECFKNRTDKEIFHIVTGHKHEVKLS